MIEYLLINFNNIILMYLLLGSFQDSFPSIGDSKTSYNKNIQN